ncbi:low temperature requirement protein A [Microbulbifer agarilyticus]|uniref:low temperature requirement protein A n=1 Tax=Microbulbifer agarilyticus TaxID=260552 RepID=UPI001CD3AB93|nr:low temperature requirement protein A [Microbulbifer agarilyticus]MCA0900903.1 low temperature requirement protein A [Microbulbifer agarilyticus]
MPATDRTLSQSDNRRATWLELFFDLVFVAVISAVSTDLAHTVHGHLTVEQLLRFPLIFIPVWWIWMTHTLYANRFDQDDRTHRFIALLIMALVVLLSTYSERTLSVDFDKYVLTYVVIRWILAGMYFAVYRKEKRELNCARKIGDAITTGALVSGAALFLEGPAQYIVFYLGIVIDICWQGCLRHNACEHPVHRSHLVERIGLMIIILLGESVISIVGSLSQVDWTPLRVGAAVAGFAMAWGFWWIYYDAFPLLERASRLSSGNLLTLSHLLLCMGLLLLSEMIKYTIVDDMNRVTFNRLAICGMVAFYVGKQLPYWQLFPPWRKGIILNSTVCLAITVGSTFLPNIQLSLMGISAGSLIYVVMSFRMFRRHPVKDYLVPRNQ